MARITLIAFITTGQLIAVRAAIVEDGDLDPRGGGLSSFSIAMRNADPGGSPFWDSCGLWRMEEFGPNIISLERFTVTVIDNLGMSSTHNDGGAQTQIATYVLEDDFPGLAPREAFAAASADTIRKPQALERVPLGP